LYITRNNIQVMRWLMSKIQEHMSMKRFILYMVIGAAVVALNSLPWIAYSQQPSPNSVNVSAAFYDSGDNYIVFQNFGTPADTRQSPTLSTLRIFENGKELGPAHSVHVDIRNLGMGRFSHWGSGTGTVSALYFSASDNTDPRTNGRVYT